MHHRETVSPWLLTCPAFHDSRNNSLRASCLSLSWHPNRLACNYCITVYFHPSFWPDDPVPAGQEVELTMHDGTVRDLCFLEDTSNKSSLLISGGAGDCKIYVTDCATGTPFQALSGHSGHVLTLYNWGGAMFVSGSQDKTVRFWDLRTRGCVNMVTPATVPGSRVSSVLLLNSARFFQTEARWYEFFNEFWWSIICLI